MSTKHSKPEQTVEEIVSEQPQVDASDIQWENPIDDLASSEDRAIALHKQNSIVLATGLEIMPGYTTPQRAMELMAMIRSFTGVTPRKAGEMIGRWHCVIGGAIVPFERDKKKIVDVVHGDTGEVTKEETIVKIHWQQAMFKLRTVNDQGQHVIISGGGQNAIELLEQMAAMGFVGDWPTEMWLLISQEEREGESLDRTTGQVVKQPRRLYRLDLQFNRPSLEK